MRSPPGDLPNPGIKPRSSALQAHSLPSESPGQSKNTGVGSLTLLQWIFLTQESNWGFLYCRQILYQLSYQGSPKWALTRYQIFWCLHLEFLNSRTVIYKLPDLVNSGSWWWTGRPGVLWFMGSQRVRHDWVTDLIWSDSTTLTSIHEYLKNHSLD